MTKTAALWRRFFAVPGQDEGAPFSCFAIGWAVKGGKRMRAVIVNGDKRFEYLAANLQSLGMQVEHIHLREGELWPGKDFFENEGILIMNWPPKDLLTDGEWFEEISKKL